MSTACAGPHADLTGHCEAAAARRALLVEDDLAIARLVQAVAQDTGVELVHVNRLAKAGQALLEGRFDVIVADLMLPDGCGIQWLESQWACGGLAASRVVAFSAGVSAAARARLGAIGVQGFLHKPVSVSTLAQWLSPAQGPPADVAQELEPPGPAQGAEAAIAQMFGGDRELYDSFRAACLARLDAERRQAQLWLQQGDLAALGRLGHSLKSALRLLGEPALAEQAFGLEQLCTSPAPDTGSVRAAWGQLSRALAAWAAQDGGLRTED